VQGSLVECSTNQFSAAIVVINNELTFQNWESFCFGFVSCGSIHRLKYNLVIPSEKQEFDMYVVLG
jgi:hypothetical protein